MFLFIAVRVYSVDGACDGDMANDHIASSHYHAVSNPARWSDSTGFRSISSAKIRERERVREREEEEIMILACVSAVCACVLFRYVYKKHAKEILNAGGWLRRKMSRNLILFSFVTTSDGRNLNAKSPNKKEKRKILMINIFFFYFINPNQWQPYCINTAWC